MFSGVVVVSGAGDGSVSVGSGCVAAGAVAEGSGVMVVLSFGVLLGVVGAVGAVGAIGSVDGSAVTLLSGVWVLLGCEPVAVITSPLCSVASWENVPHLGVRVISVPAAAFTVKVKPEVLFTYICSV